MLLVPVSGAVVAPCNAYAAAMPAVAASAASGSSPTSSPSTPLPPSAPAARSAPSAPSAEGPAAATSNATSGANAASGPTTNGTANAPSAAPAVSASGVQPNPPVTAKQPARTPAAASASATGAATGSATATASAPSAASASENKAPAYSPNPQPQFGKYALFRNLIPSPALESQAADEFAEIVRGAVHADRLYPDTDARVIRVQTIVDKLIPYSLKWNERAKNWKWEIAVIRSPDIRMYCLPGGKIVIYSGILDRVRLNDNELGMLLGHEIAHALREHARERLGEQQAGQLDSTGTIPQLFGLADLGVAPLGIGSQLLEMKYSNTDETEADVIGSDIASRAGYDPRAAITLWDKLAAATRSNHDQGYIYVHPYTPARRADIMKRLPDMLVLYAKAIGKTVDQLPDYAGIGRPRRTGLRDQ
ncbi:M48 family metallopeptidase [Paraburkholderia sp. DHOC27]|uniref:M48 family metallopeptidase n=1 Tax=Paraburkholderia sp. DHOC27 TaxID=2303330 RepID=UPI000E3BE4AA|nr:M48 family metallopeptidase [Paraburkholderia sp. DHOC27]RFU47556.1 M48 family peptidase [Paraburkholderia sp. DHOC27]